MDYESICCSLQTVRAARMFYEYGKLDRLLERDITTSSDDLYEVYYELLIAATDYMDQKFNEDYEYDHWYFSFRSMMQYYRLIREYGGLHSMKLSENPYVKKAEEMLSAALYPCCLNGGMGWGYQKKISSEWSSGLIVETDGYFHYELDLLEALLSIDAWYTEEVQKLEILLKKERALAKRYDEMWAGHDHTALPKKIVDDGIALCERILARTDDAIETEDAFGGKSLLAAARSEGFRTKCGSLCNIVYKPETICKSVRPIL